MMTEYQVCTRCVMDTTAGEISFDDKGVCSFCRAFDANTGPVLDFAKTEDCRTLLRSIAETIRTAGSAHRYDCVLGLSGGVDSAYLACTAVDLGLRPLAVHVDTGWDTATTSSNVRSLARELGIELHVVPVDWAEMRELQLAFYRAAVQNCEIPYDHAFLASLYRVADRARIRYILLGGNLATESVLPASWGHNASDLRYIKSVYARYGAHARLRHYPTLSFWQQYFCYPIVKKIRLVYLLNYLDYNKAQAKQELRKRCGWEDYGDKHHEAVSTRFFQSYYLPMKFGVDKRKAHLSSLILSGQLTREEALEKLMEPPRSQDLIDDDRRYMAEKLGVPLDEWDRILGLPPRSDSEFASLDTLFALKARLVRFLGLRRRSMKAPAVRTSAGGKVG